MSILLAFQGAAPPPDDVIGWPPQLEEDGESNEPDIELGSAGGIFESPVDVALLQQREIEDELEEGEDERWLPQVQLDDLVQFQTLEEQDQDAGEVDQAEQPGQLVLEELVQTPVDADPELEDAVEEDLVPSEVFDAPAAVEDLVIVVQDAEQDLDQADVELEGALGGSQVIEDAPAPPATGDDYIIRARRRGRR